MKLNFLRKPKRNTYFKEIVAIALPITIQGLVIQIQTLINRGFLGRLKTEYISAIGNIIIPFNTTMAVLLAISTGVTIKIANKTGEKKSNEVKDYYTTAIFYNSIVALSVFAFWLIFANKIFTCMGVDKRLIDYCVGYVKIMSLYVIVYGIDISIQSMLQGLGITKPIMYSGIIKVALNIFFDLVFIFGKFGVAAMGLYGAALSTAISNISSTVILVLYVSLKKLPCKINFREIFKPYFYRYKEMLIIGIPTGFETFIWYIGNLVLIRLLNGLDYISVGIYTLTFSIEVVIYIIYNSLAKALLTLTARKIGEKNKKEARNIFKECIKLNIALISIVFTFFVIFSKQIIGAFLKNPFIVEKASFLFIFTSFTLFPKSLNVVVGGSIRGLGDTKWMLYTQIVGTIIVVTTSIIFIFLLRLNIIGIYITILIDESIRAVFNLIHIKNFSSNQTE